MSPHLRSYPRALAGIAAAALLMVVAGCGSDDSGADADAPAATTAAGATSVAAAAETTTGEEAGECAYDGNLQGLPVAYDEPAPADLTIGWLNPIGANESQIYMQKAFEASIEALGGTSVIYDSAGNPDTQVTQFQQLLDQKVDAILVWPLDPNSLGPSLTRAADAGIPVIAIEAASDPDALLGAFTSQVIIARDLQAFTQVSAMAELHPGGEVVVMGFGVPVPSITYYVERATYWAERCGLKVVDAVDNPSDDIAGGESAASGPLTQYPDVVGVLAYNDPTAIGAATAARQLGMDVTVMGVNGASDAVEALKNGRLDLSVQMNLAAMAQQMVWAGYDAAAGGELPPTVMVDPAYTVLTPDNVDTVESWDDQLAALSAS